MSLIEKYDSMYPEGFEFYHLRIHYGDIVLSELVQFIKERSLVVLIVKEIDANRPHIHCVILKFNQTKSTFCQQLVKQYPALKGNGSYSCSVKNEFPLMIQYCLKGEAIDVHPDIIYHDPKFVDPVMGHQLYWETNMLLKAKSKKDTSLVVKAKSKTWTEKVYDEIKHLYSVEIVTIQTYQLLYKPTEMETNAYQESRKVIFRYMMKCFGKAAKKISNNIVRDIFDGFMNGIIQDHEQAGEKYSDKLYNMIYN